MFDPENTVFLNKKLHYERSSNLFKKVWQVFVDP